MFRLNTIPPLWSKNRSGRKTCTALRLRDPSESTWSAAGQETFSSILFAVLIRAPSSTKSDPDVLVFTSLKVTWLWELRQGNGEQLTAHGLKCFYFSIVQRLLEFFSGPGLPYMEDLHFISELRCNFDPDSALSFRWIISGNTLWYFLSG